MNETRYRYALSDPHGCQDVLDQALAAVELTEDDCLYLLGDYIPHQPYHMDNDEFFARRSSSHAFLDYDGAHTCIHCGRPANRQYHKTVAPS